MKIALMSDSHDNWQKLAQAVDLANSNQCEHLLFAGDLISPPGLKALEKFRGKCHVVLGNNEGEIQWFTNFANERTNINFYGYFAEIEIDGLKFYLQHYPRAAEIAGHSDLFDVCVFGHNHIYSEESIGETLLLNPGTIHGYKHLDYVGSTFIIFDTDSKQVQKVSLD